MTAETVSEAERGMQLDELLALPVAFDLDTSNRALSIGRTKGFQLAKAGEYPCRVMRIGRAYRVSRADLLRALNITPNSDGAGAATPTPLAEQHTSASTSK